MGLQKKPQPWLSMSKRMAGNKQWAALRFLQRPRRSLQTADKKKPLNRSPSNHGHQLIPLHKWLRQSFVSWLHSGGEISQSLRFADENLRSVASAGIVTTDFDPLKKRN